MPSLLMPLPNARVVKICAALIASVSLLLAAADAATDTLTAGAKNYKPYAVERIGDALAGGKSLQTAIMPVT
jgi:hypothetical protein